MAAAAPAPPAQPVLPDERFWHKHSPNQEFPISSLTAVALHVGAAVLLVLLFNFVINSSRDTTMPVELFDGYADAGGGGDPNASADRGSGGQQLIERATEDEIPKGTPKPNSTMGALPNALDTLPDLPSNPEADRVVDAADAKSKLDNVAKGGVPKKAPGQGGAGSGGGTGPGKGTGTGTGIQPGTQGSIRQSRNRRWTLTFNSTGGNDYLRQLNTLGAVLVAEYPDGNKVMLRQLGRIPVPPEPIDSELNTKMRWVDERPTFVSELSTAMGLERTPNYIKAYFPYKLETEMLRLELAFRGRKEGDIDTTTFQVLMDGTGYRLVVSDQKYLR